MSPVIGFAYKGSGGGGGGWTPASTGTGIAWYSAFDASSVTTNVSDEVTAMADKTGANDLAPFNAAAAPTFTGSGGVTFTTSSECLTVGSFSVPSSGTFIVGVSFSITAVDNSSCGVISMEAADNDWQFDAGNAASFVGRFNQSNLATNVDPLFSPALTSNNVVVLVFDAAVSNNVRIYQGTSGTPVGTSADYQISGNGSHPDTVTLNVFGNRGTGTITPGGEFFEAVIDSDISILSDLQTYLAGNL